MKCKREIIASNNGFNGTFKIEKITWYNDNSITYDVTANFNNKIYQYNGFKDIKKAFEKMKRYQLKAMKTMF